MKAIRFKGYGVLQEMISLDEIPVPVPADNDVLVRIVAASINPVDYKIVGGSMKLLHRFPLPQTLGFDFSGEVSGLGKAVSDYKIGDLIYGRVGDLHPGTFAEYICTETKYIAPKPKNLSHEEAACIPLVGQTTVQALSIICEAKAGQKILIHAGSGGIGVFAIQYAKYLKMHVAATTSTANVAWVKSLGADEVIDYKTQNYLELIKDYDLVYDTLGGKTKLVSMQVLKPGGKLVSIVGPPDKAFAIRMKLGFFLRIFLTLMNLKINSTAKKYRIQYYYWLMQSDGKLLAEMTQFIEAGAIKVFIDKTFPLSETLKALEYVKAGRTKGKVVIKMVEGA